MCCICSKPCAGTMSNRTLILDAGNTALKVAQFENGHLSDLQRLDYGSADAALAKLASWNPGRIILSSVSHFDASRVEEHFETKVVVLSSEIPLPLSLEYSTPETLGADRLANACGAAFLFPGSPLLVIDIGTCITADFVDAHSVFHGGCISPGPVLRSKAMHGYTAHLPEVELSADAPLLGKSTVESLRSGIHIGIVDEILGRASRLRKEFQTYV